MKLIRIVIPVLLLSLLGMLAGCSSTPTRVDKGTVKAKTFNFVNGGVPPRADFADNRTQAHELIQKAISDYLTDKGMTKVAAGGDVTVAYLVILGNNVAVETINTYFGYGRDSSGLSDEAVKAYTGKNDPNYFEAGTLLVDIIDNKDYKLLQRHYATRPLLRNPSAEARAVNIREAVYEVMKNINVAP